MTNPFPSPMDALAGLLDERKRYESWLAHLETRRSDVPGHVLERVRADYEERLHGVLQQLGSRTSELETSAASMQERIDALLAEETARRDERAEAELRAAVGEFSSDYARDLLARCDEAITQLSGERNAVSSELTRVEEILALVRRPRGATPPEPQRQPAAEPAPAPAAVSAPAPAPPPPSNGAPLGERTTFDELAFLQSVVQPRPIPVPAPSPAAAPVPSTSASPSEKLVPPSFPNVRRPPQPAMADAAAKERSTSGRGLSVTSEEVPAFLKDMPTEQAKTLKCQECGTMNYATEWYCERCGGELAAM